MAKILTLEVTDELAARLDARAQEMGVDTNHFAVARLEMGLDLEGSDEEPDSELVAALQKGLEEVRNGQTLSMDEAQEKFDAFWSDRFGTAKK